MNSNRYRQNRYYQPSTRHTRKQKYSASRVLFFILALAVVVGYFKFESSFAFTGGKQAELAKVSNVSPVTQAKVDNMNSTIESVITQYPDMEIAVSMTDLKTGKTYNYGESNTKYIAASVSKLLTATLFLHDVQQGDYSLNTRINGNTAKYELQQMIVVSDNDAWQAFNDLLGHDVLDAWAKQAGLINYVADDNELTTQDVSTLLVNLFKGKLINKANTQLLLSYMKQADITNYIVSSVPNGINVYHKAGWLDDRVHDAAIIDDGKNPYTLVIFTKQQGNYDTNEGQQVFQDITKASLTTFVQGQ
jgi:beta-lactamase class A